MICEKCGYGGLRIDNTPGLITCLNGDCGHTKFINGVVVHRGNSRAMPIAANTDCQFTNQCPSALRGECYRPQFQAEEYTCPVARGMAA